jgi:hypothetical protein
MEAIRHSDWGAICHTSGLMQELDHENIFIYPIVKPRLSFEMYFLHHPRRPLTLAARCFVDILERNHAAVQQRWDGIFKWPTGAI